MRLQGLYAMSFSEDMLAMFRGRFAGGHGVCPLIGSPDDIEPVLKAWMIEQTGPRATLRRFRKDWPDLRYALERLPIVARKFVDETLGDSPARGGYAEPVEPARPAGNAPSHHGATAGAALLVSAAIWLGLDTPPSWVGWLAGLSGLLTLWLTRPNR